MENTRKILIVEDDETTMDMMKETLLHTGFPTNACLSGEEAWEKLQKENYDLLFLDINLPEMSGLELCKKIRQEMSEKEIYIVAATGKDKPEDLQEILTAGANDYMAKPINPKLLAIRTQIAEFTLKKIEEKKDFEQKLQRSEERHRIIAENGRDVVATCKKNGDITYINQAIENLLGYSQTGMVGLNLLDFVHPEDQKHALPKEEEILNGTLEETTEFRMKNTEGKFLWVEASHRPIQNPKGTHVSEWITYIRESQGNKSSELRFQILEEILDEENQPPEKILEKIAHAFSAKALLIEEISGNNPPYKIIMETGPACPQLAKAIELFWQGEKQERKVTNTGKTQRQPYLIPSGLGILTQEEESKGKYPWEGGMIQNIPKTKAGSEKFMQLILLKKEKIEEREFQATKISFKLATEILSLQLNKHKEE